MKKNLILLLVLSANLFAQGLDYKYDFKARIEYDTAYLNLANEDYKEADLTKASLSHKGSFFNKTLFYKTSIEVSNELKFKDNYIAYKNKSDLLDSNYRFKFGNIKVPFSLDAYAGSKYSTFMESPLSDVLTQNRKLGLEALLSKKISKHRLSLFLGAFKNSIDEKKDDDIEKTRYALKTTYSYQFSKNHLLYFASSFLYSDINNDKISYKQEAESSLIKEKYVSSKIKNVNNSKNLSVEALYINKSFHMQSEYIQSKIDAQKDNYIFNGHYAQIGYFLFGSSKSFKQSKATFSGRNIKKGDVELAFRYSFIDLNDKDERGGTQKDYNFAVNYYINKNLKFMTNYIKVYPRSSDYNGEFDLVQARIALTF